MPPALRGLLQAMADGPSASTGWPWTPTPTATPTWPAALDDMDDRLDQLHKDYIQADPRAHADARDVQAAVQLALVGRYYERIGDHAVNIGERVQYMVTGLAARARRSGAPWRPGERRRT